jgi:glycosyltransferase involved in cell wall biosynthesis
MHNKYLNSDILVFASTYEGFGMPIIEAQACGVAVVTSNLSSMPEVGGKESAVYVDPYDVLSIRNGVLKLMQEVSFREQVIARGFENVKRFDPATISNMYLELYRTI